MKTNIKNWLSRLGLLPVIDLFRRFPGIVHWLQSGCIGAAPPPIKRRVLLAYLERYELTKFIETGTYLGDTLAYVARHKNVHATSIELDQAYFQMAKQRFIGYSNVSVINGDSGEVLPQLVRQLKTPALFWLDGHYSGGETGKSSLDTPISIELGAILESEVKGHVILIDDARCFDGTQDYPQLDRLLEMVRRKGTFHIEVSTDIIRLTPKS